MGTLSSGLSRDTLAWLKLTAFKTCVSNWHCLGATIELSAQEQYFVLIFTPNTAWLMTGAWSARKPEIWPTSPRSSGTASSWSVQWIGKQVLTAFPIKIIKLRSQGCHRVLVSLFSWPGQLLSLNPCQRPKILARMLFWGILSLTVVILEITAYLIRDCDYWGKQTNA